MNPLKNLPFYFKPIKQNYQKGHDGVKFIIVHDTGNKSRGANAQSHFNYFNGRYVGASADYFVDDKQIVQTVSDYNTSWHCGDNQGHGRALNGAKNRNSIGVEICINSDGNYELAVANALELVKNLQKLHGVPDSRVQRHYDVSRKRCAGTMISNNWARWKQFKNDLKKPMILKIDTRTNSIAKTVSGSTSSGGGSAPTPTPTTPTGNVWYGDNSKHNSNKAGVKKLQQNLITLGYPVGSSGADGYWGKNTRAAVVRFQQANKSLKVDGMAGGGTLALLQKLVDEKNKPKPKPSTNLTVGSKGEAVTKLQEDLMALGYDVGAVGANGHFGALTKKAVEEFQSTQSNLKRDGIAGKETLARVDTAMKTALRFGSKGSAVTRLQTNLKDLGYNVSIGGAFGKEVEAEVKKWQKDNKLTMSGIVSKPIEDRIDKMAEAARGGVKPTPKPKENSIVDFFLALDKDNYVSSPFGVRIHPISKVESIHKGVDIAKRGGASPEAIVPDDGNIIFAGDSNTTAGNWVVYQPVNSSYMIALFHLDKVFVKKGDKVKAGQVVAVMGATGAVTGRHWHLEVRTLNTSNYWAAKYHDPNGKSFKITIEPDEEDGLYRVQVGAFSKADNARLLAENLKKKGFDAIIKQDKEF